MLPELIYREEKLEDYRLLVLLGGLSVLTGFVISRLMFPSMTGLFTVVFGSIPLVYPLTSYFLEKENGDGPHTDEIITYSALFIGEVFAFVLLGLFTQPETFGMQIANFRQQLLEMGITTIEGTGVVSIGTGYATGGPSFFGIFFNNLVVFTAIITISTVIGSAGAFVLTWNASVLGVFFAILVKSMSSGSGFFACGKIPSPLCYVPHATFEFAGFIIAGLSGSLISAALYRRHFDLDTWKDYAKLVGLGLLLIVIGALLETA